MRGLLALLILAASATQYAAGAPGVGGRDEACRDWALLVLRIAEARDAGLVIDEVLSAGRSMRRLDAAVSPDGLRLSELVALVYEQPRASPQIEAAVYYGVCARGSGWH